MTLCYQYDAEFTYLHVNARSASEIVSKLLFTHKKFCFKQVREAEISDTKFSFEYSVG